MLINEFAMNTFEISRPLEIENIEQLLPPAAKIFFQTHILPLLRKEGVVHEIYLKVKCTHKPAIPVLLNAQAGYFQQTACYHWVLLPAEQRANFEQELIITRKKLQEFAQDAEASRYMLQSILDGTQDIGILAISQTGLIRFANIGAETIIGQSANTLINQSVFTIFDELLSDKTRIKNLNEFHPKNEALFSLDTFETKIFNSENKTINVKIQIRRLDRLRVIDDMQFILLITNIDQQKLYEKLQNDFIANISHEFRTPITSILGSLDLLNSGKVGDLPEKFEKLVNITFNNAKRLKLLVNDIVDFAKLKSTNIKIDLQNSNLNLLLATSIEEHHNFLTEKEIAFDFIPSEVDVYIQVDPLRFGQIMSNLLSNAIKFSPNYSTIRISIFLENDLVTVSVEDEGPGVKPEFIPFLFTQFRQQESETNRQYEGSGLGLAISKHLIKAMNGEIGYTPTLSGSSIFWIRLPLINSNSI